MLEEQLWGPTMNEFLVGFAVLMHLGGSGSHVTPLEQTAQSQEKSRESPPEAHLIYREASRRASPTGDFITYVLRVDGLPEGKSYSLTGTWMNGKTYKVPEPLHLDSSGRVLTKDGSEFNLILGGTFAGEFIRFTLLSDDGSAKAAAEITPVPIEAVGNGGCRLTVRPLLANGQAFSIIGERFQPGDEIKTVSTSSGKVMEGHADNKGGNLKFVVFPAVAGQSGGDASLTASDKSCSVTVRYAWGDAMMKLSPTANQVAPGAHATSAEHPVPTPAPEGVRPEAATTPHLSKGAELLRLAMLTVALDHKIALINTFLPHAGSIDLGKERVTHENAKDVLERLQRERRALTDQIDQEGFSNIAGDYDWRLAKAQDQCKLRDVPPDASGPVSVVQNGHEVEFKGNGFKGCGVIAGTVVVLRPCEGVSTLRLLTRTDTWKVLFFDATDSSVRCDAGYLTKRPVER